MHSRANGAEINSFNSMVKFADMHIPPHLEGYSYQNPPPPIITLHSPLSTLNVMIHVCTTHTAWCIEAGISRMTSVTGQQSRDISHWATGTHNTNLESMALHNKIHSMKSVSVDCLLYIMTCMDLVHPDTGCGYTCMFSHSISYQYIII